MGKIYMTVKEVAKMFSVSCPTIWRWVKNGDMPKPHKLNGATRWKTSELEDFSERLQPSTEHSNHMKNLIEINKQVKKIPPSHSHKQITEAEKEKSEKKESSYGSIICHLEENLHGYEIALKTSEDTEKFLKSELEQSQNDIADFTLKISEFKKAINQLKISNMEK